MPSGTTRVCSSIWVENTSVWVLSWKPFKEEQALLVWGVFPPSLDYPQPSFMVVSVRIEISLFCLGYLLFLGFFLEPELISALWLGLSCLMRIQNTPMGILLLKYFLMNLVLLARSARTAKLLCFMWTVSQISLMPDRKIIPYSSWHRSCTTVLEWPKGNAARGGMQGLVGWKSVFEHAGDQGWEQLLKTELAC